MKNYQCSNCHHEACMACAKKTWKTGIPLTGGEHRPLDATGNLVCCKCYCNQLLTVGWHEIAVSSRGKATVTTYPDLFEAGETKI